MELSLIEINKCIKFADDVFDTNKECYRARNQDDPKVIKNQIATGKAGELGIYKFLEPEYAITYPDFNIYNGTDKSWECDMKIGEDLKVHVKSQSEESANRFGLSWVFQWEDPLFHNATEYDVLAFTKVSSDLKTIEILGIPQFNFLKTNKVFSQPKNPKLWGVKKVIYYDTIKELEGETLWYLSRTSRIMISHGVGSTISN